MNHHFLLIDTSTEQGLAALFDGEELLKEVKLPYGLHNSRSLLPELELLFKEFGLAPQDLAFVAVGIGPGSYTGVRVGVVVAKMLHMACGFPLVGVCSLKAYAPSEDGEFAALLDARVAGAYLLEGKKMGEAVTWKGEPRPCPLDELPADKRWISPHKKLIAKLKGACEHVIPSGKQLGLLAWDQFKRGDTSKDGRLDILYLRKTQAEIEWEKS